ncbi:MAG TPA: GNAT family N-acetyltransferase [Acidobacteriaceae bacterium]|nr:GNAT family N-acetyltransferase [Acidobacteriaceae bacterium]
MARSAPFLVRQATLADAEGILACLAEAFAPFREQYTPGAFADTVLSEKMLAGRFASMTILVAEGTAGEFAGTVAASLGRDLEGHLRGMAVRAAWQGSGVAAELLADAESMLWTRGCRRITLDTTAPLERAIAFYRRHGYAPTGRVQDFFGMPLYEYAKEMDGE